MGFCGALFKASAYVIVALVAVLAYFHLECQKEKVTQTEQGSKFDPFNPKQTDVVGVPLGFCTKGEGTILDIGLEYILLQSAPCAVMKLFSFFTGASELNKPDDSKPLVNITIHDARKSPTGDFQRSGFTLIELDREPETKDWRTNAKGTEDADILKFYKQMEPHIKRLYPEAKRIEWTHNVVRGGDKFGDQPRALGPHLDYFQDDEARLEFHKDRPVLSPGEFVGEGTFKKLKILPHPLRMPHT